MIVFSEHQLEIERARTTRARMEAENEEEGSCNNEVKNDAVFKSRLN